MAAGKNDALINIIADNSDLRKKLSDTERRLKGLEKAAKKTGQGTQGAFGGLSKSLHGSIGPLAGISAGMIGIGAAVGFIKSSVTATEQLALSSKKLSRETGMGIEQSSAWISLAKERGIKTEQLGVTFGQFSKVLYKGSQGNKTMSATLAAVGVSMKDVKGQRFGPALGAVADSFKKMGDGPKRTALAMQLFGRSGRTLLPILSKGSGGIKELEARMKELGLTVDGKTTAQMNKLRESSRTLHGTFEGMKIQLGSALMPHLASAAQFLAHFTDQMRAGKGTGGQFMNVIKTIAHQVKAFVLAIKPAITHLFKFLSAHPGILRFALVLVGLGLAMMKTIGVVNKVIGIFKTFAAFMRLLPLSMGLVGIALMVLVVVAALIISNWGAVKKFLKACWDWIKEAFGKVVDFVKSAAHKGFLGPVGLIITHWTQVKDVLKSVWDSIKSTFSSGVNHVIDAINIFIDGINLLISAHNLLPGKDWGKVGHVDHVAFAMGGIVTGPTRALIGEDGAEAIVPLSRKHRARGQAMYEAAGRALGVGQGGNTFNITNIGNALDENALAARMAWQLSTRSAV